MSEEKKIQEGSKTKDHVAERLVNTVVRIIETYIKVFELEVKSSISDSLALIVIIFMVFTFTSLTFAFFSVSLALLISYLFSWPYFIGFSSVGLLWIFLLIGVIKKRGLIYMKMLEIIDSEIEKRN